jgi:ribosomal protein S18 acetylase RimI-like enzyme
MSCQPPNRQSQRTVERHHVRATSASGDSAVPLAELREDQIGPLLVASEAEGFGFVRRVVSEWETGVNRFTGRGEALLGYVLDGRLVAICGLMRDPYQVETTVGRLRNLYVLPQYRCRGIGAALTRRVMELARPSFQVLRLRAATPQAAALYEGLGFTATTAVENCTHIMSLVERL